MPTLLELAKDSRRAVRNNRVSRVENGEYDVTITDITLCNRKDGQGSYYVVFLEINDGEYANITIPDIISFHPNQVKSSLYSLEELLDVFNIELEDSDYASVVTLFDAIQQNFGEKHRQVRIRYYRDGARVRIDYIKNLSYNDDATDPQYGIGASDDPIDLSEIPF